MTQQQTLGQRIKVFRQRAKKSQFEFEMDLGMSSGSISRIESGEVNPTKETLEKVSKELGLNQWEFNYLIGKTATPVTKEEVVNAQDSVCDYFKQKGVYAYIVDERSRVWDASVDFLKLFSIDEKMKSSLIGESVVRIMLDDSLGFKKYLNETTRRKLIFNVLTRTFREMSFMDNDEYYQYTLSYILGDSEAKEIWREILSSKPKDLYTLESKNIDFVIKGLKVDMKFSVEPLLNNERFRVVDYIPNSKIIRLMAKLI